ncbi:hypothetical protein H5410_048907 [Solanum commersonii]|uniref:S-protein homolog n=1 Tax=Solanum commersonii TaxID=4109 RepID=A0A9J5XJJ6_SOLCO|nr:hypothetical protein H5410_048907 [Solanum commersonii]
MSSSSQYYHLVLCLFLLSFSSLINSQEMFLAHVKNETPNLVKAKCSLYGGPMMDYLMESGHHYTLAGLITPDVNNTIYCEMKLREKHGGFMLYDSNDTKTCHFRSGDCEWYIHEDGLCM